MGSEFGYFALSGVNMKAQISSTHLAYVRDPAFALILDTTVRVASLEGRGYFDFYRRRENCAHCFLLGCAISVPNS